MSLRRNDTVTANRRVRGSADESLKTEIKLKRKSLGIKAFSIYAD